MDICAAVIDAAVFGMPDHDPFGSVRRDATFWADVATPHELEAYGLAALSAIPDRIAGKRAARRVFAALWHRLPETEKRAFAQGYLSSVGLG